MDEKVLDFTTYFEEVDLNNTPVSAWMGVIICCGVGPGDG